MSTFLAPLLLLLTGLCLYVSTLIYGMGTIRPLQEVDLQERAYNFNPEFLSLISLNYKKPLVASMWVKTMLDSDTVHYKARDLGSWLYQRFHSMVSLSPSSYEVYLYGGMYLSVIKDDIVGARDIFERGLSYFPKDPFLNYYYGMLRRVDFGDPQGALPYLITAHDNARMADQKLMIMESITSIMNKNAGTQDVIRYLENLKKSATDDKIIEGIDRKIAFYRRKLEM